MNTMCNGLDLTNVNVHRSGCRYSHVKRHIENIKKVLEWFL